MIEIATKVGRNALGAFLSQLISGAYPLAATFIFSRDLSTTEFTDVIRAEAIALIPYTVGLFSFEIDGIVLFGERTECERTVLVRDITAARFMLFSTAAVVALLVCETGHTSPRVNLALACLATGFSLLNHQWVFLAAQRNLEFAGVIAVGRVPALAILLFTPFVSSARSALLLTVCVTATTAAVASALIARTFRLQQGSPPVSVLRAVALIRSGSTAFLGNLAGIGTREAGTLVIVLAGASGTNLAAFTIAERLIKAIQVAFRPFNQLAISKLAGSLASRPLTGAEVVTRVHIVARPHISLAAGLGPRLPSNSVLACAWISFFHCPT